MSFVCSFLKERTERAKRENEKKEKNGKRKRKKQTCGSLSDDETCGRKDKGGEEGWRRSYFVEGLG